MTITSQIAEYVKEGQSLDGLVEYQGGSVVSRTMMNKTAGTITLFAFDDGQALSEHTAPFDALLQVIEGEADITVAAMTNRVRAGELIVLPAGVPHAVKAVERFKMLLVMIRE
jgi:quercetin dioxygenase-like cupin family protein